ncbi:MAG: hypothetical protein J6A75_08905, partial [Lachnospiraceae bacterium]|nr:hypothetical protein [Lachnospiraceae bacterium]
FRFITYVMFTVLRFATFVAVLELFSKSFKVISLFSYQCSLLSFPRQPVYNNTALIACQQLFSFFCNLFLMPTHCFQHSLLFPAVSLSILTSLTTSVNSFFEFF